MAAPAPFPAIPYGWAFFKGIRREGCLYIDKTRFLHALEQVRFAFFIRPRRFGKSCWLSLLESYYARTEAADFEAVFAGTAIAAEPTPNRSRYVVLRFDFSAFNDAPETLEPRPPRSPGKRYGYVIELKYLPCWWWTHFNRWSATRFSNRAARSATGSQS